MIEQAPGFALPPLEALLSIHEQLIARDGGAPGIRDEGALQAALARPAHVIAYGGAPATAAVIACTLAYSIARIRHPFMDGNKRVAFAALVVTLAMNGRTLEATAEEATEVMLGVAGGGLSEAAFVAWVERSARPPTPVA